MFCYNCSTYLWYKFSLPDILFFLRFFVLNNMHFNELKQQCNQNLALGLRSQFQSYSCSKIAIMPCCAVHTTLLQLGVMITIINSLPSSFHLRISRCTRLHKARFIPSILGLLLSSFTALKSAKRGFFLQSEVKVARI